MNRMLRFLPGGRNLHLWIVVVLSPVHLHSLGVLYSLNADSPYMEPMLCRLAEIRCLRSMSLVHAFLPTSYGAQQLRPIRSKAHGMPMAKESQSGTASPTRQAR